MMVQCQNILNFSNWSSDNQGRVIAKFVRSTKSGPKMWFSIKNGFHQSKKYFNNLVLTICEGTKLKSSCWSSKNERFGFSMSCCKADISWCDFTLTWLVQAFSSISGSQTHFSQSPSTNRNTVQRKKLSFFAFILFFITIWWPSPGFVPFCQTGRKWRWVLWLFGLQITCQQDIACLPTSRSSPIYMATSKQKSFPHFLVRAPRNGTVLSAVNSFLWCDFCRGENRRGLTTRTLSEANICESYR